jgi:membrane protein YqaA with SNARE-associated domain
MTNQNVTNEASATSPDLPTNAVVQEANGPFGISWRSLALIAATILLTIALLFVPTDLLERLGNYGYLGVFVLTLLANASIVLPSPAVAVAALAGATLNPWLVGVLAGVGASLGEITGYMAGLGGSELAARSRYYAIVERWVKRWGVLTIFTLAFIPGPGLDLAGIAAGTLRIPFRNFLLPCMLGKVIRFILVAWLGYWFL